MSSELRLEHKILQKAEILQLIRSFFNRKDFIEVDTGIMQSALVPELHVHSFHLPYCDRYLLPSPELAMKELLCRWDSESRARSIYQLAHCFRQEDEQDSIHFWEFLMLEFYGLDYTTMELLSLLDELLQNIAQKLKPSHTLKIILGTQPIVLSFEQLCKRALGLEFNCYWELGLEGLQQLYSEVAGTRSPKLNLDDLFHLFLVDFLEPYMAKELPYCALYPYPDITPLPAKYLEEGWVDRWELYLNGLELANACGEENRIQYLNRYRTRFIANLKKSSDCIYPRYDLAALNLWQDLPNTSGAALGLDRLLAL